MSENFIDVVLVLVIHHCVMSLWQRVGVGCRGSLYASAGYVRDVKQSVDNREYREPCR